MTKKKTLLVVLSALLMVFPVLAQTQNQAPQATSITGSILDKLKDPKQAQQLQQALDLIQKAVDTKAEDSKPGEHKTAGDALDKGMDMAKEAVVYLAGKVEQVAPQLWRVMILQQYVKGFASLVSPLGFLFLIAVYRHYLLKWWKPQPGDDDAEGPVVKNIGEDIPAPTHKGWRGLLTIAIPLFAMVCGVVWLYSSVTDATGYFINPNYYALHDIILLVKNPGAF